MKLNRDQSGRAKINVGDVVTLPVSMDKGNVLMSGKVVNVFHENNYFRVEYHIHDKYVIRESYCMYGILT